MITRDTYDISKANKAEILASLYNSAKPMGMGVLHYTPEDMTIEEAQELLDTGQIYFDYVKGRCMKVNLSTNNIRLSLYDRDTGHGAGYNAIKHLID
jgi:hypothetical protein